VHRCGQKLKIKKGTTLVFSIDSVPSVICPTCGLFIEWEDVGLKKMIDILGWPDGGEDGKETTPKKRKSKRFPNPTPRTRSPATISKEVHKDMGTRSRER
jgi:hypothetical protein